jgi:uncharacterized protein (TIGR03435 family)
VTTLDTMLARKLLARSAVIALLCSGPTLGAATFDESLASGANFDKAEFRLWLPDTPGFVRALAILVPGSNGDGRDQVDDPFWQAFAITQHVGLVGVRLTDKTHDQMFIEHYVDVSKGSGQAFLDALTSLAAKSHHPEIAMAPLLLWGMSAGGEFNYEFTAWRPERVVAFVVNKGNVYYTALAPDAARRVPGILFTGENDLAFRIDAVAGLFAINRRAGALWGYAQEPGVGHEVAHSREFAAVLFEDMLRARLSSDGRLKPLDEKSGFFGDAKTQTVTPVAGVKPPANYPVSWLPTARVARAWQAVLAGKTVEVNAPLAGAPQTAPARQTFEVATIKVNRSGERRAQHVVLPRAGRLTLTNIPIRDLIQEAYGLPFATLLMNVPDWARTERVDVVAKAPSAVSVTVLQQMLQPLLAEYFKLSAHRETRDMDVFAMVLATPGRLGPQLKPNLECDDVVGSPGGFARAPEGAPNARGTCGILPGGAGRIIARGLDMPGLAAFIGTTPGRMLIDRTGLAGRFDVDLTYTPSIFSGDAPERRTPPPGVDPSGPPLITALQQQLGLKLQPLRAPIEVLVIDHAEPLESER